jgi:hypothetical protein
MFKSILLGSLLPLLALAQETATATQSAPVSQGTTNTLYNGGDDNPQDPSDAGAAGASNGAFTLSKGALAAIIVVAVLVAVGGSKFINGSTTLLLYTNSTLAASAILFWLAKKRQWNVRESIRRASRRFTGRSNVDLTSKRENRRTGVRLNSPPPSKSARAGQNKDVEKGLASSTQNGRTTTTITSTFDVDTPTQKGWKSTVLGGKR